MLTLYQFPISHYCEKVRWALDYKQLDYQVKNLLPGPHAKKVEKLAGSSSLPILVHDGKAIQNSSTIISYLDEQFQQNPLTPSDKNLKQAALDWENFLDKEIGINVRRIFYHAMLDHPKIVIPFYTNNGPWYGNMLMKLAFPRVRLVMLKTMSINDQTVGVAQQQLSVALEKLHERLSSQPFLVGDHFTRADLTAAALLAPLCKRPEYGIQWPELLPEPLENIIDSYSEKLAWVNVFYENFRNI